MVTVCAADLEPIFVELKERLVGERVVTGVPAPVPLKATVCGEAGPLSKKLRVAVKVPVAVGLKVNATVQEAPVASDALHEVEPLKAEPLAPETVGLLAKMRVDVPVFLRVTDCEADAALMAVDGKLRVVGDKLTATVLEGAPVPLNATVCPEVPALSAKTISADSAPSRVGLNVTVTVQEALTARVAPQVVVSEKEATFAPERLTPEMVMGPVPALVRVTAWVAADVATVVEAKVRLGTDRLATGVFAARPVPVSAAVCGELAALSAKLTAAESAPEAAGLKVTVTVQEALTANVVPQVLDCENEEVLAPVRLTPEMDMEAAPELVSLTVCTAAEDPTAVEANVRLLGDRLTAGPAGSCTAPGQPFTTLATFSEPRPVALSYPIVAA